MLPSQLLILALLREAIRKPMHHTAEDKADGKKYVAGEIERLIPGATLLGTTGFGDAIIRHMGD